MTASEQPNPFEKAARYAKAVRLSRVMIAVCRRSAGEFTADDVARAGRDAREIAARIAHVNPPSDATWAIVVDLVRTELL